MESAMTIKQLYTAINTMRLIYPYNDDDTWISIGRDLASQSPTVRISTRDEETEVDIVLEKAIKFKIKDAYRKEVVQE